MSSLDFLRSIVYRTLGRLCSLHLLTLEEFTPGMGLDEIKAEYQGTLYEAMAGYLESERTIVSFRNSVYRAVSDGFTLAFYAGYADAGGSGELPAEAVDWLNGRIDAEVGFADGLFQDLKALRADKEQSQEAKLGWCESRAAGYTGSLDGVYSEGKMRGDENQELWFLGDDGMESCSVCQRLKGQHHPAKWWIENGLVLENGNENYECRVYNCAHTLETKDGEVWAHGGAY